MMKTMPHPVPPMQQEQHAIPLTSLLGTHDEGVVFGSLVAIVFLFVTTVEYVRTKRAKNAANEKYANAAVWGVLLTMTAAGCSVAPEMVALRHDISILLTVGSSLQLLAFGLLWLAPRRCCDLSVPRAPVGFAVLSALALSIRVAVEMVYSGYLPVDQTGDGLIQILDFLALVLTVFRLGRIQAEPGEAKWTAALGVASVAFGHVCYGELDEQPLADQAFAVSVYLELAAWVLMLRFVFGRGRDAVNSSTFPLTVVAAMCRSYFWYTALPETRARHPSSWLMAQFPAVLVLAQVAMGLLALAMSAKVVTEFRPAFSPQALLDPNTSLSI